MNGGNTVSYLCRNHSLQSMEELVSYQWRNITTYQWRNNSLLSIKEQQSPINGGTIVTYQWRNHSLLSMEEQ